MLILCGMPTCGKDTVLKILKERYGLEPIIRFTTRPFRPGEIDGKTYHGTDNKTFEQMIDSGMLAEFEIFHVADDDKPWYYGSIIDDYTSNRVMICSPDGIKMLKEGPMKDEIFVAQLFLPEDVMRERIASRNWSEAEVERRISSDYKRYADVKMLIDVVVPSYGDIYPPERVAELIYRSYVKEMGKRGIPAQECPELF